MSANAGAERDIAERLGDFENCGGTATDRVKLRMDALYEIVRLRSEIKRLRDTAKQVRTIEHIERQQA